TRKGNSMRLRGMSWWMRNLCDARRDLDQTEFRQRKHRVRRQAHLAPQSKGSAIRMTRQKQRDDGAVRDDGDCLLTMFADDAADCPRVSPPEFQRAAGLRPTEATLPAASPD